MATFGRRQAATLGERLLAQGERFDFFQAIALLERAAPWAVSVGAGPAPHREAVSLRSSIAMSFPPSDVERIRELGDKKTEITARLMGLAGALGPLPAPYCELVMRRAIHRDHALRDFLDIFNHRLLSLFYQVKKRHRVALGVRSPVEDRAAEHLYALIGLGTPGLRDRLGMPDRALLHYAGVVAHGARSMVGLEVLLSGQLGVRVRGEPLTGRLCVVEPEDRTAIGAGGRRRALGRDAMIGDRVWIQDAAFELTIGPLSSDDLPRFLPGGDALGPLCQAIDFYAGDVASYSLRLLTEPSAAPQARLGRRHGSRLSYTAWLGPRSAIDRRCSRRDVRLSHHTLAAHRAPPAPPKDNGESP